ncbi:hypothetical protein CEXT_96661 [Caerostris extrusa]|uniref:Uncharacterized protein n=1 Tax=Caerostris extrusa TaxID=172846 RepID=A0AAV4RNE2_CAEEX|nr:hypothetical protein CEXT_96661 [Caerostris extrusa]
MEESKRQHNITNANETHEKNNNKTRSLCKMLQQDRQWEGRAKIDLAFQGQCDTWVRHLMEQIHGRAPLITDEFVLCCCHRESSNR